MGSNHHQVWSSMLSFMGSNHHPRSWTEEKQWCLQKFTGNTPTSSAQKMMLNATIYHLWLERNRRLFDSKELTPMNLSPKIINDVRLRLIVLELEVEDTPQSRNFFSKWNIDIKYKLTASTWHTWHRPDPGWVTLNTDGSLQGSTGGYGALIRDQLGTVLAAGAGSQAGQTVILHELQGAETGLRMALRGQHKKLVICIDSANAVRYINTSKPPPWEAKHTTRRIKDLLKLFEVCKVIHVVREANRAADKLGALMPKASFIDVAPSSFAEDLKKIIFEDASGRKYMRM